MNVATPITPCCPTCGHVLPYNRLVIDLNANCVVLGGVSVKLEPREAEILAILQEKYPRFVSRGYLEDRVCGMHETARCYTWLPVYLCKLRKKLTPFGVLIINRPTIGYQLQVPA